MTACGHFFVLCCLDFLLIGVCLPVVLLVREFRSVGFAFALSGFLGCLTYGGMSAFLPNPIRSSRPAVRNASETSL